jgi:hypothetical protein
MKHLSFIVCLTLLLSLLVFTSCETYEAPDNTESEPGIESEGSDAAEDATTVTEGESDKAPTDSDNESADTSGDDVTDTSVEDNTVSTESDTEGITESDTDCDTESDTESDTEGNTEDDTEDDTSEDDNTVTLPWLDV